MLPPLTSLAGSAGYAIGRAEVAASVTAAQISRVSDPAPADPDLATDFVTLSQASDGVAVGAKLARTSQEIDTALLSIVV